MTASKRAFSWTCQPNINEVKPHNTRHRTKSNGFLIDIQSLYKHGCEHKWIFEIFELKQQFRTGFRHEGTDAQMSSKVNDIIVIKYLKIGK